MAVICESCVNDRELKALISVKGKRINKCSICNWSDTCGISTESGWFYHMLRALIRYHFHEWQYNRHWGGERLECVLRDSPLIFNFRDGCDKEEFEEAIYFAVCNAFDPGGGISLYGGDGILRAIKDSVDGKLEGARRDLIISDYLALGRDITKTLKPLTRKVQQTIKCGESYFRARIGYERSGSPFTGWGSEWHFEPYRAQALGPPPASVAQPGRLNRAGVSYLYLATDVGTAIAEIRPHPGHRVSAGEFACQRELRIADFGSVTIRDYCKTDKKLYQFQRLDYLNRLFALPIVPEERSKYSFTQFLSDCIRNLGYDGIGFRSSVGKGKNLLVFDPATFEYKEDSSDVYEVQHVDYSYEKAPQFCNEENYLTDLGGKIRQLSGSV